MSLEYFENMFTNILTNGLEMDNIYLDEENDNSTFPVNLPDQTMSPQDEKYLMDNFYKVNNENQKVNIMTEAETLKYLDNKKQEDLLEKFNKEFKANKFKKNQPDGSYFNENTGKFEKLKEYQDIDNEIEMMMNDPSCDVKNYYAKSVSPDIAKKVMENPKNSTEILLNSINKVNLRDAMKDLNSALVNEILSNENKKTNVEKKVTEEKFDRSNSISRSISEIKTTNTKQKLESHDINKDNKRKKNSSDKLEDFLKTDRKKGENQYPSKDKSDGRSSIENTKNKSEIKKDRRSRSKSKIKSKRDRSHIRKYHHETKSEIKRIKNKDKSNSKNLFSRDKKSRKHRDSKDRSRSRYFTRDKSNNRLEINNKYSNINKENISHKICKNKEEKHQMTNFYANNFNEFKYSTLNHNSYYLRSRSPTPNIYDTRSRSPTPNIFNSKPRSPIPGLYHLRSRSPTPDISKKSKMKITNRELGYNILKSKEKYNKLNYLQSESGIEIDNNNLSQSYGHTFFDDKFNGHNYYHQNSINLVTPPNSNKLNFDLTIDNYGKKTIMNRNFINISDLQRPNESEAGNYLEYYAEAKLFITSSLRQINSDNTWMDFCELDNSLRKTFSFTNENIVKEYELFKHMLKFVPQSTLTLCLFYNLWKLSFKERMNSRKIISEFGSSIDELGSKNYQHSKYDNLSQDLLKNEILQKVPTKILRQINTDRNRCKSMGPIQENLPKRQRDSCKNDSKNKISYDNLDESCLPLKKSISKRKNAIDNFSIPSTEIISSPLISQILLNQKRPNEKEDLIKSNLKKQKTQDETENMSDRMKIEKKKRVEEKMSNDPNYNLLLKLSHKISTKEAQDEIKKLISSASAKKLDEVLNKKTKETVEIDLYETSEFRIFFKINSQNNTFKFCKKIKY